MTLSSPSNPAAVAQDLETASSAAADSQVELISPYGGRLVNLLVDAGQRDALKEEAGALPSIQISERAVCDLELLATGAFSPLDRFMGPEDFRRVIAEMRLADGAIFPIPITLPVAAEDLKGVEDHIALRDSNNNLLAVMDVEHIYPWDMQETARLVFGTTDARHPLVAEMHRWGDLNVSGRLRVLALPRHYDFESLRMTPTQVRTRLASYGHENVVAFQTRNPLHRVHEALTKRATESVDGTLLLHPVVGMTKPGDVDHFTRVRTYRALVDNHYESDRVLLSLLPLAMRMAGPREALWHALIRRNFGANHIIVGRDHAGAGVDSTGKPFHGPYDAQELVAKHQDELGVKMIPFKMMVYVEGEDRYEEEVNLSPEQKTHSISGTQVREEYLAKGKLLPEWFSRREVAAVLRDAYPPRHKQGVCIWFTGLSGSGKSTIANVLKVRLEESGRQVTVLDGDVVRTHLSKGLGFSKDDRDTNIRRIGFVASEIVRHGGTVICAAISPYRATRDDVRNHVGEEHFCEVYVDTPLAVCEARDVKGLYAKARRGEIKGFTGIDDPYEQPAAAEVVVTGDGADPDVSAEVLVKWLRSRGYIADEVTT